MDLEQTLGLDLAQAHLAGIVPAPRHQNFPVLDADEFEVGGRVQGGGDRLKLAREGDRQRTGHLQAKRRRLSAGNFGEYHRQFLDFAATLRRDYVVTVVTNFLASRILLIRKEMVTKNNDKPLFLVIISDFPPGPGPEPAPETSSGAAALGLFNLHIYALKVHN